MAAWRIRPIRFHLIPRIVWLNVSATRISISIHLLIFTWNIPVWTSRGERTVRTTTSIPGTGIYHTHRKRWRNKNKP